MSAQIQVDALERPTDIKARVDELFGPTGLMVTRFGREHRVSQFQSLHWGADFLTADLTEWRAANKRVEKNPLMALKDHRALIGLGQFETGMGKTDMLLGLAGIYSIETGHRVILLTSTIGLRNSMMEDAQRITDALSLMYPERRPLRISERRSLTNAISVSIIRNILGCGDLSHDDRAIADGLLQYTEEAYRNGSLPLLDQWMRQQSKNAFPLREERSPFDFRLTEAELKGEAKLGEMDDLILRAVAAEAAAHRRDFGNDDSDEAADIVISTHATGALNFRYHGNILGTMTDDNLRFRKVEVADNRRHFRAMFVDEADSYRDSARSMYENRTSIEELEGVLAAVFAELGGRDAALLDEAVEAIKGFMIRIQKSGDIRLPVDRSMFAFLFKRFCEAAGALDEERLSDVTGLRLSEIVTRVRVAFQTIDHADSEKARHDGPVGLAVTLVMNNGRPVAFGVASREKPNITNRLWRGAGLSSTIERVMLVSGTLAGFREPVSSPSGPQPRFDLFRRHNGIYDGTDLVFTPANYEADDHAEIGRISFGDPSGPNPFINEEVEDDEESKFSEAPDFTAYCASTIVRAVSLPPHSALHVGLRSLVLFPSDNSMMRSYDWIAEHAPDFADRIILQRAGMPVQGLMSRYIDDPDAIWFGPSGVGSNFVHEGKTLVGRVIIPRLPVPPSDHYMNFSYLERMDQAMRRTIQYIGRAMRFPVDRPDVHILDPRLTPVENQNDFFRGAKGARVHDVVRLVRRNGFMIPSRTDSLYARAFLGIRERWIKNADIGLWKDGQLHE